MSRRSWRGTWAALLSIAALLAASTGAGADASSPAVSGPVAGPATIAAHTAYDLATVGYVQEEFFLDGTAVAYEPLAALTSDGAWSIGTTTAEEFRTRILVNRPVDPGAFNGTVVVEWLNVSGGADASPDWIHGHVELLREGYAWVGVSAQKVGLDNLVATNPGRYGTLFHPGDSYSYDMYSQAGQSVLDQPEVVLGGLVPQHLLAVGESQSAGRLVTYVNAVHPLVEVYDGYLIHSRGSAGAALSQAPLAAVPTPTPTHIRTDLDVPVLVFMDENDSGVPLARQADTDLIRYWEVAGTAHFDYYGLVQGAGDVGDLATVEAWLQSMRDPQFLDNFPCPVPVNTGPQTFVIRAAIAGLHVWMADGTAPPVAPRLQLATSGPSLYELDGNGNALGGIRTPAVDAAVATLSGFGQPTDPQFGFCRLFGTTVPLSGEHMADLYRNHGGFVAAWNRATQSAVKAGFVLPEDGRLMRAAAARSDVLRQGT